MDDFDKGMKHMRRLTTLIAVVWAGFVMVLMAAVLMGLYWLAGYAF